MWGWWRGFALYGWHGCDFCDFRYGESGTERGGQFCTRDGGACVTYLIEDREG